MSTQFRVSFSLMLITLSLGNTFSKEIHHATDSTQKNNRPNIIIILADDMGFSDLGCFGSEIATPYLDQLAAGGMRMNNFYNCGRCCPSRASLLTGLYPHQAGVGDMLQNKGYPAYQGFLDDSCVTIAELLKQAGYHTITSGKWHVGTEASALACNRGFDKSFTMLNNGSSYYKNGPLYNDGRTVTFMEGCTPVQRDTTYYLTQQITDFAVQALDEQKNNVNPFFLYVTYTAPHWPIQAPQEDIDKYKGHYMGGWDKLREARRAKMIHENIADESWKLSTRFENVPAWETLSEKEKKAWDLKMAIYAAMVNRMDQGVGEILHKLKETGQDKNTLIIFLSDNGGSGDEVRKLNYVIQRNGKPGSAENIDSYDRPWGNVSNTPFRTFKRNVHEGGISTPFIAYYPGVISPGTINPATAHIMDILPTCLDVAQIKYPATFHGNTLKSLTGVSLMENFKNFSIVANQTLFWEHEGNKAVRDGKWKLVYELDWDKWELYDMTTDRSETNDLSAQHPDQVKRLKALHDQWCQKVGVVDWLKIKSN
ncbi:MAG: sulfatase [Chitinophagaceae bacterium]|nr:sulfatase [Chitinophagaceae bacterium]